MVFFPSFFFYLSTRKAWILFYPQIFRHLLKADVGGQRLVGLRLGLRLELRLYSCKHVLWLEHFSNRAEKLFFTKLFWLRGSLLKCKFEILFK